MNATEDMIILGLVLMAPGPERLVGSARVFLRVRVARQEETCNQQPQKVAALVGLEKRGRRLFDSRVARVIFTHARPFTRLKTRKYRMGPHKRVYDSLPELDLHAFRDRRNVELQAWNLDLQLVTC